MYFLCEGGPRDSFDLVAWNLLAHICWVFDTTTFPNHKMSGNCAMWTCICVSLEKRSALLQIARLQRNLHSSFCNSPSATSTLYVCLIAEIRIHAPTFLKINT